MNKAGQWRITPPTHVVGAFLEALRGHEAEGGVAGRGARYERNRDVMVVGMRDLGFEFDWFYDLMKGRILLFTPAN